MKFLVNDGLGGLTAMGSYITNGTPKSPAIGDINHDGSLDVVGVSALDGEAVLFTNNGDATFN